MGDSMSFKKVWLITGAGAAWAPISRRLHSRQAMRSSHPAETGERVSKALGNSPHLLTVTMDVNSRAEIEAAVRAAVERFGRLDVLVNNAASFFAGYFEELSTEQIDQQLATSLIGPMNVTRAVLPVMRQQRSGHIITISSVGWNRSRFRLRLGIRRLEVRPRGLDGVAAGRSRALRNPHHDVNPASSVQLLTDQSTSYASPRSPTTTSAVGHSSSIGRLRMGSSLVTR